MKEGFYSAVSYRSLTCDVKNRRKVVTLDEDGGMTP